MRAKTNVAQYIAVNLRIDLTHDQVVEVLLYELDGPLALNLSEMNSQKEVIDVCKYHLYRYGVTKLSKPLPADLLLRRQDVLAQTKGLIPLTGGLPIMR
jgi:hypothetical protein